MATARKGAKAGGKKTGKKVSRTGGAVRGRKAPARKPLPKGRPKASAKTRRPKAAAPRVTAGRKIRPAPGPAKTKEKAVAKVKQTGLRVVKDALLKRREFLRKNLGRLAASATSVGEKPVGDRADDASIDLEVDNTYSIAEQEAEELRMIDAALEKIAKGTYGVCEECGGPIERPRLKALPYAVLCLKCKQAEEVEHVESSAVNYGEIEEES